MTGFVTLAVRKTTSLHKSSIREFAVFILEIDEGVLYFSIFSLPVHFICVHGTLNYSSLKSSFHEKLFHSTEKSFSLF